MTIELTEDQSVELSRELMARFTSKTQAWLGRIGSWDTLEEDAEHFDPGLDGGQYVTLSLGGIAERHSAPRAGLDLIGFHIVLEDGDTLDDAVNLGADSLDAAIVGRADMIVRAAGRTDPDGLISRTGSLRVRTFLEDDQPHVVARMKIAMAMPVSEEDAVAVAAPGGEPVKDEETLPPALTAEPEVPITPAGGGPPAALAGDTEPEVEPGKVEPGKARTAGKSTGTTKKAAPKGDG